MQCPGVAAVQEDREATVDTATINELYRDAFRSAEDSKGSPDDYLINRAWKMSIDIGYDRGIADGYYYTGTVYMRRGVVDVAARYFEKAVSLYTQGQFLDHLPDSHRRLGKIYIREGRYYTGLQNFLDGLRVATDGGYDIDRVRLSVLLADYHNTISKDYEAAVAVLDDMEELEGTPYYQEELGAIQLQYGISYLERHDYEQALHYIALAKQVSGRGKADGQLLRVLLAEGNVYASMRDEQRLAAVLDEAGPLADTTVDARLTVDYRLLYATHLYLLSEYEEALATCEALYPKLGGVDTDVKQHRIRTLQIKIFYALGDRARADSLFGVLEHVRDSLYTAYYTGQSREMTENYQLDRFERQIKEQELMLSNTRYQRYGLLAGIAVLLTILIILYFHFREKDKLAHRVAIKNTEISVQNEVLKQANKQNELLLREIHHRVKNNLQIINSLLSLQSRKTANPDVITMMRESSSRIHSIALIHNKLYEQQSINQLNIQDYIEQLGAHLLSIYSFHKKEVKFEVDAHDVLLDIDTAIPVGLILTELITNSLKYAFVERENGCILVDIKRDGDRDYELVFKDNGVGIPEEKRHKTNETLGFRLIHSLASQLAGVVQYTFDEFSMYRIRFKG